MGVGGVNKGPALLPGWWQYSKRGQHLPLTGASPLPDTNLQTRTRRNHIFAGLLHHTGENGITALHLGQVPVRVPKSMNLLMSIPALKSVVPRFYPDW